CRLPRRSGSARVSRGSPQSFRARRSVGRLGRRGRGLRGGIRVDEFLELFAGLEEGDALGRHFHFLAGLGVAPGAATALARTEAAKAADLDFLVVFERLDDAFEDGLDDGLRFLAGQLRNESET